MPPKNPARLLEIYDFIASYRKAHGIPPTVQQIADGLGLKKPTVYYHLQTMELRGMIRRERYVARGLVLLNRES